MNLFVPVKQVFDVPSSSNSRAYVCKYPLYIRQLFRKKNRSLETLYERHKNKQLKARYEAAELKFASAVDSFNVAKETQVINNGNIGAFDINNKLVTKTGVAALKDSNAALVHDDADKLTILNQCYSFVLHTTITSNRIFLLKSWRQHWLIYISIVAWFSGIKAASQRAMQLN